MKLTINGVEREVEASPDMPLLWVLCDLSRRIQSARELWPARAAGSAALGSALAGPQDGVDRSFPTRAL